MNSVCNYGFDCTACSSSRQSISSTNSPDGVRVPVIDARKWVTGKGVVTLLIVITFFGNIYDGFVTNSSDTNGNSN